MFKNKKIMITIVGLVSVLLASSILLFIFVVFPKRTQERLEENLKNLVVDYYETEFKTLLPTYLETRKELDVDLEILDGMEKDISEFIKNDCSLTGTYGKLTYKDDDTYDIEVILDCKI